MFLYIKYGELFLKGKNIHFFINKLNNNIKFALKKYPNLEFKKKYNSLNINCVEENDLNDLIYILKNIPGIGIIIIGHEIPIDFDLLKDQINNKLGNEKLTFKIQTKRINKKYPLNSMEINIKLADLLLDSNKNLTVDINKPKITIYLELENDKIIYYFEKIKGIGGFPVGTQAKVLMLISGGIDSPVAAKLLNKKGCTIDYLTFMTPPHTSEQALTKVKDLVDKISLNRIIDNSNLYIVNFTNIMHELAHTTNKDYQITLMRRYFFRIAKKILDKYKYDVIATGESLGQVASQTIDSMKTISNVVDCLIFRPLLTYDKEEIINLSIKFGLYEISIKPYSDCCSLFVPASPTTKPSIKKVEKLEEELTLIDELVDKAINKIEIIGNRKSKY